MSTIANRSVQEFLSKGVMCAAALMAIGLGGCSANESVSPQIVEFEHPLTDREDCEATLSQAKHDWGPKEFLLNTSYYVAVDSEIDLEEHFFGVPEETKLSGGPDQLEKFMQEELTLNSPGEGLALFTMEDTQVFRSVSGPFWYASSVEQACVHVGNGIGLTKVRFARNKP